MEQLKACPFCGADAELNFGHVSTPDDVESLAYVICRTCGAKSANYHASSDAQAKKLALHAWNARSFESANGLIYVPSFRDNGIFPEYIWASLNGEAIRYVRERTCYMETAEGCQNWNSCSVCDSDYYTDQHINYCPNCGAKVERGGA